MNVWLRSANRSNANNAWNVNSSGKVNNNNNAYNANRGCPDCLAIRAIRPVHSTGTLIDLKMQGAERLASNGRTTPRRCGHFSGGDDRYYFKEILRI